MNGTQNPQVWRLMDFTLLCHIQLTGYPKGDSPPSSDTRLWQNLLHSWLSAQEIWKAKPKACPWPPEERGSKCIILRKATNLMATYWKELKCLFSIKPVRSSQDVFGVWIINFGEKGLIPLVSILGLVQRKHLHKDKHPQCLYKS